MHDSPLSVTSRHVTADSSSGCNAIRSGPAFSFLVIVSERPQAATSFEADSHGSRFSNVRRTAKGVWVDGGSAPSPGVTALPPSAI